MPCLLPGTRCALTAPFHPYPAAVAGRAVYFLLHFPSARAAQELPGALPMRSPDFPLPEPARLNQAVTTAIARLTPGYILVRNRIVCHLRHSRCRLSNSMGVLYFGRVFCRHTNSASLLRYAVIFKQRSWITGWG